MLTTEHIKRLFKKKRGRSIAFISFHKCATSFFSSYILKQAKGLEHVDPAGQLYGSHSSQSGTIVNEGELYGVIRILDRWHPSYSFINGFLSNPALNDIDIIFWIRDPRDILVSMYYSFGFLHGFSTVPSIRAYQEERRERIQNMTLDAYVLDEAPVLIEKFEVMKRMMEAKNNFILLSYEEMINDFDSFFDKLSSLITLDDTTKNKIYEETRPKITEDAGQHKRKGSIGAYKEKLKSETITELNNKLLPVLTYFHYGKVQ